LRRTGSPLPKETSKAAQKLQTSSSAENSFSEDSLQRPDASESKLLTFPLESKAVIQDAKSTSDDFRFAASVSYFGALLRKSRFAGSYTYDQIASLAEGAKGEDKYGYRREFVELVRMPGQFLSN